MYQMLADGNDNNLALIPEDAAAGCRDYSHEPLWEDRFQNLRDVLDAKEPDYVS